MPFSTRYSSVTKALVKLTFLKSLHSPVLWQIQTILWFQYKWSTSYITYRWSRRLFVARRWCIRKTSSTRGSVTSCKLFRINITIRIHSWRDSDIVLGCATCCSRCVIVSDRICGLSIRDGPRGSPFIRGVIGVWVGSVVIRTGIK